MTTTADQTLRALRRRRARLLVRLGSVCARAARVRYGRGRRLDPVSPWEHAFIARQSGRMTSAEIAAVLGRGAKAVQDHARAHGLGGRRAWTPAELATVGAREAAAREPVTGRAEDRRLRTVSDDEEKEIRRRQQAAEDERAGDTGPEGD